MRVLATRLTTPPPPARHYRPTHSPITRPPPHARPPPPARTHARPSPSTCQPPPATFSYLQALYELPEEQLSVAGLLAMADDVEMRVQGGLSPRPLFSVPHILAGQYSA